MNSDVESRCSLPLTTASVRVQVDRDLRIVDGGRPMLVRAVTVDLSRPDGSSPWQVDAVRPYGVYAKGRLKSLEGASEGRIREAVDSVRDWRVSAYEARSFVMTEDLEVLVGDVVKALG